jgi:hypothetical protein
MSGETESDAFVTILNEDNQVDEHSIAWQEIVWKRNPHKSNSECITGGAPVSEKPLITETEDLEAMRMFNK